MFFRNHLSSILPGASVGVPVHCGHTGVTRYATLPQREGGNRYCLQAFMDCSGDEHRLANGELHAAIVQGSEDQQQQQQQHVNSADAVPSDVAELLVVRHGETTWNAGALLQVPANNTLPKFSNPNFFLTARQSQADDARISFYGGRSTP